MQQRDQHLIYLPVLFEALTAEEYTDQEEEDTATCTHIMIYLLNHRQF